MSVSKISPIGPPQLPPHKWKVEKKKPNFLTRIFRNFSPRKWIDLFKNRNIIKDPKTGDVYKLKNLSKSCFITNKKIKKMVKAGTWKPLQESVDRYRQLPERFGSIKPKALVKIMTQAFIALKEGESTFKKIGNTTALISRTKGKLEMHVKVKVLGKGAYGIAELFEKVESGQKVVIKFAKREGEHRVFIMEDIQQEAIMLRYMHTDSKGRVYRDSNGKALGIQELPKRIVRIGLSADPNKGDFGYLGHKYDGDGTLLMDSEAFRGNSKQIIDVMHQLFSGLSTFQAKGVVHEDIKPENILVKGAKKRWVAHFADFGGARRLAELPLDEIIQEGVYSPAYAHHKDLEEIATLQHLDILNKKGKLDYSQHFNKIQDRVLKYIKNNPTQEKLIKELNSKVLAIFNAIGEEEQWDEKSKQSLAELRALLKFALHPAKSFEMLQGRVHDFMRGHPDKTELIQQLNSKVLAIFNAIGEGEEPKWDESAVETLAELRELLPEKAETLEEMLNSRNEHLREIFYQRDIYSTAVSLYEILTGVCVSSRLDQLVQQKGDLVRKAFSKILSGESFDEENLKPRELQSVYNCLEASLYNSVRNANCVKGKEESKIRLAIQMAFRGLKGDVTRLGFTKEEFARLQELAKNKMETLEGDSFLFQREKLEAIGLPKSLIDLFERALDADYAKRPKAEEFRQILKEMI